MGYSEDPDDAELVQLGIASFSRSLFKAGPGIVRTYDPVTNTAFVQPAVKHASYSATDGARAYKDLPEIPFVPVIFPRAGGFVVRSPVLPGDTVLLVYCDSSHAEWRTSDGVSEPEDARRHSIGYPVAIPGFFPDSKPPSATDAIHAVLQMIVGQDGGKQVRIGDTGIEFAPSGVTPISPVALAPAVIAFATALKTAIDAQAAAATATTVTPVTGATLGAFLAAIGTALVTANASLTADAPSTLVKAV